MGLDPRPLAEKMRADRSRREAEDLAAETPDADEPSTTLPTPTRHLLTTQKPKCILEKSF